MIRLSQFDSMKSLHQKIKQSKYRQNREIYAYYGDAYYDQLQSLLDLFWSFHEEYPQIERSEYYHFYHDFSRAIQLSKYNNNVLNGKIQFTEDETENIETRPEWNERQLIRNSNYIERCLGSIHYFITTHRFDSFYVPKDGGYARYQWDTDKNDFLFTEFVRS